MQAFGQVHILDLYLAECNIHATQVTQEANLPCLVAAHERDDDVALLPLKAIDGVHSDEGTEELAAAQQLAQQLHLGAIRRDNAGGDLLSLLH